MVRFTAPLSVALPDPNAEAVRKNVDQRVREIQDLPAIGLRVIKNVSLPNGVVVLVEHLLGRKPLWVGLSIPRGAASAGIVSDFGSMDAAGNSVDRAQYVPMGASSYGATITVDVLVL